MFRKKKPQPTLADRAAEAQATADLALFGFQRAIESLDAAAEQHNAVANEAESEIARLGEISDAAFDAEYEAVRKADKLRELFA